MKANLRTKWAWIYSLKKKDFRIRKKLKRRDEHIAKIYKILKKTFLKSVRWYDIIHYCIKHEGVGRYT